MLIFRKVVYRPLQAKWFAVYFDTGTNEFEYQEVDGAQLRDLLNQMFTDYNSGYDWQCEATATEYVFDRVLLPQ